ncbi:hypothetical protein HOC37_05415 [bacterium]|jgi:hypothetical protein|nr:hypothetical protein [bacterium]MBT3580834.1 hypothetical protein [bacterium]MBT4552400.1 hypothetical protein [bacterium]MBT5989070.1 hypothetical protein [bacterium]MBT7088461.1 hypothetical protein [bacterium]
MNKNIDQKKPMELAEYFTLITQLGLVMISQIFIFFFLGLFLVKKFHLPNIFILLFVLVGIISGFYFTYALIRKAIDN